MRYRRRAKFFVQGHISSLGAQGDFHGLGHCINAFVQRTTRIFSKNDLFSHNQYSSASILKFISLPLLLILLTAENDAVVSIFPTRHSTAKEPSAQEGWKIVLNQEPP